MAEQYIAICPRCEAFHKIPIQYRMATYSCVCLMIDRQTKLTGTKIDSSGIKLKITKCKVVKIGNNN